MSSSTEVPPSEPAVHEVRQPGVPQQFKIPFSVDATSKKDFYDALTAFVKEFGPLVISKAKIDAEDFKKSSEFCKERNVWVNYEFRYNKKFRISSMFALAEDIKITSTKDTLQFKGRNAANPELLVFEVTPPKPQEGEESLLPWIIQVDQKLVREWLRYGMIY